MQSKTVHVPAISCQHCVHTIQTELKEVAGVQTVQADAQTKQVSLQWDSPATWESLSALLSELGYPAQDLIQL
jgi:copper chaperone CopZ